MFKICLKMIYQEAQEFQELLSILVPMNFKNSISLNLAEMHVTNVSAGRLVGLFWLNRSDSGLVDLFGRDRSDPAAHAEH